MKNKMILVMALCVAFFAAVPSLKADPVDVAIARKVAVNFLIQKSGHVCPDLVDVTAQMPFGNMYFFVNPQGRGFVIVAADDRVFPILGYSTENNFEIADLPQHIESWYRQYDNEIARIIADDIEATDDILDEWARLIKGNPEPASRMREKSVAPLLTTTWGQGSATTVPSNWTYNYFCPDSSGKKALAGYTAVATAQVMKYWNHPAVGHGSRTYTPNNASFGQQSANFANTTYAWSDMPNSLSTTSDTTERNAVATLLYHVGVAVNMNYGVSGSSAPTVNGGNVTKASSENALISYFKYSSSVHSVLKADFSDADWIALLKSELDASTPRPIIYSGWDASAGHSFVLDGYNVLHQFHINWGWRGNYDGYYTMGALNPSNSGTGGNSSSTYNRSNQAVIGIQPISNTGSTSAVT
ncbi:MAG: C10 family peptidase, partial [Bacteroidales bacterium]|nr:C10 family peptidase [Bacteroidales bacterium]